MAPTRSLNHPLPPATRPRPGLHLPAAARAKAERPAWTMLLLDLCVLLWTARASLGSRLLVLGRWLGGLYFF